MRLSTLIKAWEVLHVDDTGKVGFNDVVQLFEARAEIQNDVLDQPRREEELAFGGDRHP